MKKTQVYTRIEPSNCIQTGFEIMDFKWLSGKTSLKTGKGVRQRWKEEDRPAVNLPLDYLPGNEGQSVHG